MLFFKTHPDMEREARCNERNIAPKLTRASRDIICILVSPGYCPTRCSQNTIFRILTPGYSMQDALKINHLQRIKCMFRELSIKIDRYLLMIMTEMSLIFHRCSAICHGCSLIVFDFVMFIDVKLMFIDF